VVIALSTPTPIATANSAPLQLYIIAHDRAYMRIVVDGVSAFDGRVLPNNVYTFSGNDLITLLTGNGEALEVYFNQEFLGKLGAVGEVVDLRFSLQGLQTPTPRPQLTPTTAATTEGVEVTPERN
jgi:cytoskeleton protein RodZ